MKPAPIELRPARLADAQCIGRMSRDLIEDGLGWSWTPARVENEIHCGDSVVLTALGRQRLLGFALMRFREEDAYLNLLAVTPEYQRLGIGRGLVQWLEESARVAGTFLIYLEVRAANGGARAFYQKLGYKDIAIVPRYYCGRETAVRMARDLCSVSCGSDFER